MLLGPPSAARTTSVRAAAGCLSRLQPLAPTVQGCSEAESCWCQKRGRKFYDLRDPKGLSCLFVCSVLIRMLHIFERHVTANRLFLKGHFRKHLKKVQ